MPLGASLGLGIGPNLSWEAWHKDYEILGRCKIYDLGTMTDDR